jgi:alkylated DNA repair dioxygenase AlkB
MKSKFAVDVLQGDLFSGFASISSTTTNDVREEVLSMPNAEVTFYRNFFDLRESDKIFQLLRDEINWRQDKMKLYGKDIDLPRKTAWYGDQNKSYTFSGIHLNPEPWTPILLQVKERIEKVSGVKFNSVLLNLYRHGNDGISWHTDAEPELGENPVIGSVSFGGTRRFMFRHRQDQTLKTEVELTHGSFLLMAGETQHFWQHQIPKTSRQVEPRINLTFRSIID